MMRPHSALTCPSSILFNNKAPLPYRRATVVVTLIKPQPYILITKFKLFGQILGKKQALLIVMKTHSLVIPRVP
jgi:hypothetical protein